MPTAKLSRLQITAALLLGAATTFTLHGYRFGQSNQSVYLLDALRRAEPSLLTNDWFTTQTLQYHWAYSIVSSALMRLNIIEPAFFIFYLLLLAIFHLAWFRIVRQLGGSTAAYLIAVTLSALAAADTGLGMYQFFQDGALLPSNVSNVLLLAGIAAAGERRTWLAGVCFGIAGIFHLNHALVGSLIWIVTRRFSLSPVHRGEGGGEGEDAAAKSSGLRLPCRPPPHLNPLPRVRERGDQRIASLFALLPSAANIAIAARTKLARSEALPLGEFVDLYVRLRHPHHYQPSSWPIAVWFFFGVLAFIALLRLRGPLGRIVIVLCGLMSIALLGAGVFWLSETLVQLSLFRFSIYVELLGCSAAAVALSRLVLARHGSVVVLVVIIGVCLVRGSYAGAFRLPRDDADYVALCGWVREHTPTDAVLLVPPDEESMRLIGRRAIVVNFKAVPQLSAELIEWRRRLCAVLDLPSLDGVPRGYAPTLAWLRQRYDQLPPETLVAIARRERADFIVTRRAASIAGATRVPIGVETRCALYAVWRE